jgi:hypothetical protein
MSLAFRMTTECVLCEVRTEAYELTVSPFTRQVQETILGKIHPFFFLFFVFKARSICPDALQQDISTSYATREIQAGKGGTCGREC